MASKRVAAAVTTLLLAISLTACAKTTPPPQSAPQPPVQDMPQKPPSQNVEPSQPITNPPPGSTEILPGAVDVVVRKILRGYLDAVNRKAYDEAGGYWSKLSSAQAELGKTAGVSNWDFISSEMIDSSNDSAKVQLNFNVDVAAGTNSPYTNGRNVRYVTLHMESGGWKIMSMGTSP